MNKCLLVQNMCKTSKICKVVENMQNCAKYAKLCKMCKKVKPVYKKLCCKFEVRRKERKGDSAREWVVGWPRLYIIDGEI